MPFSPQPKGPVYLIACVERILRITSGDLFALILQSSCPTNPQERVSKGGL